MKSKFIKLFFFVAVFFFLSVSTASAATLTFSPSTINTSVGTKFKIDLILNVSAGESVWGYDAYLKFPSTDLTYSSSDFVPGPVFSTGGKTVSSVSGSFISVGGYYDTTSQGTTTGGVVASLFFTGNQASTGAIQIVCNQFTSVYSSGAVQTNLFTTCLNISPQVTYTIGGGGSVTSTPTATIQPTAQPTSPPSATDTPVPTSVPGSATNTPVPTATGVPALTSTPVPTSLPGEPTYTPVPVGSSTALMDTGSIENVIRAIYIGMGMIVLGIIFALGFYKINKK
jgi:hypothetical protein